MATSAGHLEATPREQLRAGPHRNAASGAELEGAQRGAVGARRPRLPLRRAEQAASAEPGALRRSRAGPGPWAVSAARAAVEAVAFEAERSLPLRLELRTSSAWVRCPAPPARAGPAPALLPPGCSRNWSSPARSPFPGRREPTGRQDVFLI
ncbi:TPA: hypothetical protein BOS_1301 [Bos taurus]|nr:TPA: hypothetical protein BOS_1301 [Bos taurus]